MRLRILALVVVTVAACGRPAAAPPTRLLPSRPVLTVSGKKPTVPEWSYWEPYAISLTPTKGAAPELPASIAAIVHTTGAEKLFDELPQKELLLRRGFYTVRRPTFARIGDRYAEWARAGVPVFLTLDTLFFLVHVAIDRAYAEAEATLLGPRFDALLARMETSLAAQAKNASADLVDAYAMARGVLAVATALLHPHAGPETLARGVEVQRELELIRAHRGVEKSPLLGVPTDYSVFGSGAEGERDGRADAMAWLSLAPFALAGRTEEPSSAATVGLARVATRAVLLLARAVDADVDATAAKEFAALQRFRRFAFGASDDASVSDIDKVAERAGLDLADPKVVVDITKVDRLRHAVSNKWTIHVNDGTGLAPPGPVPSPPAVYARLFGRSATEDAEVLAALVSPPLRLPEGEQRTAPSGLDVMAWLGSAEAKAAVLATGDERRAAYDQVLGELGQRRAKADEAVRHHSVYASLLDALGTYVAPSAGDATNSVFSRPEWRLHKVESAAAGWTLLRHDAAMFGRSPMGAVPVGDVRFRGDPSTTIVMVEPHPEAMLKLVALLAQVARGLQAFGGFALTGTARAMLTEVDAIVRTALEIAVHTTEGEPLDGELKGRAGTLPYRIADLEARLAASGAVDTALVADVHHDLKTSRVLHVATGNAEDMVVLARTAAGEAPQLAMGVVIPYYEFMQDAPNRLTDGAWRKRLAERAPPRTSVAGAYALERPQPAAPQP